ncbi:MAG: Slp family lipoprotein [Wenzhouxiangella sp.]|nr:Slp family lipoprotein [Wenzhouxiangella sp.]
MSFHRIDLIRATTALALLLLLAGCASIPAPLAGEYADFQPEQATERSLGAEVRWGGSIVDTRPGQSETCLEILARDLDSSLRPVSGDMSYGRFLACREGFQDPAVFTQGRDVTVVGRLTAFTQDTIGEFVYRYPRLDTSAIYLWPERPDVIYMDNYPYRGPWWPYMGPWWY